VDVSRRRFLLGAAAAGWAPELWNPARAAAWTTTLARAGSPEGTTLVATVARGSGSGYVRLREGPGWPVVVRTDLASLRPGRDDRRRPVASFVHLTDIHLIDAQSPGRVEFLDQVAEAFSGAFRPQETLTTHVQSSMVARIRQLRRGPISGRRFDCAVSTGDNVDNCQHNELDWFIGVLDGRAITPDSGSSDGYEGVQATDWPDHRYWHPDGGARDDYLDAGFPEIPGLLEAAVRPHTSPGLDIPWYSTYGNHDGLIQGNLPRSDAADQLLVANFKITDLPSGTNPVAFIAGVLSNADALETAIREGTWITRPVTADPARRTVRLREWVQAHLDSADHPGPAGHGYDESHLDAPDLSYRFQVAPGVVGLSMDTGGYNSGAIRETQLRWLERELASVHSRSFDAAGAEVRSGADDQLVVLFSHFTSETMTGAPTDPAHAGERTIQGPELVAFLHRWPNLVAWVNGHTHSNEIRPMPDPSGRTGGFWQVTTASHVDFPEQARIVEIVDNGDGTLSIFTTMIEHAAPIAADYDDLSPTGLAAISRELSANNDLTQLAHHVGAAGSLNTELGLAAPFDLARAGIGAAETRSGDPRPSTPNGADDGVPTGALVGGGAALVAAGVGAAVALRRRGQVSATEPES
jgi:metallophosphoesterase (TIGR03767 family)